MPDTNKWPAIVINLMFIAVSAMMLLPFLLVIAISVSSDQSIVQNGYKFIPQQLSLDAYRFIFERPRMMMQAYAITILVTLLGTASSLLLTVMTAYTISRRDFGYGRPITFYIFFTMLFSGGLVPSYILMTQVLGLKNSLLAMILPGMLTPWNIMIMKGFLGKIPFEIIESGKVDGAKEFRIFFRIIIPLSTPSLATIGLLISFYYWNSWMPALLYIDRESLVPIQLLLVRILNNIEYLSSNIQFMHSGLDTDFTKFPSLSARMALAIVAAGPMLFIFPFFQKYFVKGLTVGSLKG